jgi:hypothetical protein
VAPEPEGSSPHSQQPATGHYPEPGNLLYTSIQSPWDSLSSHPPIYILVFQVVSFLRAFPPKPLHFSPLSHGCHTSRPPYCPWFDPLNNIWWWVQIPNPRTGGSPRVGCPRLIIQYIRSYPPYLEAVSSTRYLRTSHAVVTGDPLNIECETSLS